MNRAGPTYMDLLVRGEVQPEEIDDFIEAWHEAPQGTVTASQQLCEHLGMTWDEYRLWVERPEALHFIASARKTGRSIVEVLRQVDLSGPGVSDYLGG